VTVATMKLNGVEVESRPKLIGLPDHAPGTTVTKTCTYTDPVIPGGTFSTYEAVRYDSKSTLGDNYYTTDHPIQFLCKRTYFGSEELAVNMWVDGLTLGGAGPFLFWDPDTHHFTCKWADDSFDQSANWTLEPL